MSAAAGEPATDSPRRVLEPNERLSEVLFGLIMALTFTGSISAASDGREEIRTMLYGAIGCNLAWGIVDAVMYLLNTLSERGRQVATLRMVREARDPAVAEQAIAGALPSPVASLLGPADYKRLREGLLALRNLPDRARLNASDFLGAACVCLLVFVSTFPLVVPFLLLQDPVRALRFSHSVGVTMLFLVGFRQARFSGLRPWSMGLAMVGLGLVLVGLTIALGG